MHRRSVSKTYTEKDSFVLAKVNTIIFISTDPEKKKSPLFIHCIPKYHKLIKQGSKIYLRKNCVKLKWFPNTKKDKWKKQKRISTVILCLLFCVSMCVQIHMLYSILHISLQPDHVQLPTCTTIKVTWKRPSHQKTLH